MLLPLQGANTIRLALPRVSSHVVRLALGCVLLALQAVPTYFPNRYDSEISPDTLRPVALNFVMPKSASMPSVRLEGN